MQPLTDRPLLMGILNVTPDSFSDGGLHFTQTDAVSAGVRMMDEGADLIDVGGESTRPNAEEVTLEEELRRVLPVIEALSARGIPISIDTMKPGVTREALKAGATIVNDVTALSNPEMRALVIDSGCTVCLMHMQGTPRTMQKDPTYGNVVSEVRDFLTQRANGLDAEKVWIDPGIGFGKTVTHNLQLLDGLEAFVATGYPVMIGLSRKSFIGRVLGKDQPLPADDRVEGTLAAQTVAQMKGVKMIRAHDVRESRRAIDMVAAIMASQSR